MKLNFTRNGTQLVVKATIYVPTCGAVVLSATLHLSDEAYAGFATEAIQSQMNTDISEMRRVAYEGGWRDACSKKTQKQKWFSPAWGQP